MIYEIFKAFAVDGLGWWEFAAAVVASVLIIHCVCWIAGSLVSAMYSYVQDGEEKIQNFMWTAWSKVCELKPTLNGWYATADVDGVGTYWRYKYYMMGMEMNHTDRKENTSDLQQPPEGYHRGDSDTAIVHVLVGMPFYISGVLLAFDALPVLIISIAAIYSTLRLTRTVVRISKRVTKIETQPEVTTVSDGDA